MELSKGQKLLVGENVEVRPLEEGLRGSWHAGVVIKVEHLCRSVEYRDFVTVEERQDKFVERVQVTEGVEGLASRRGRKSSSYRNRIRPPPPPAEEQKWTYGLCVDAFYRDGWWEGVLLDDLQFSQHRSVLFPDEGDALTFHTSELRVTQDWDEKEGTWSVRGPWILATMQQDLERPALPLGLLWYHLRQRSTFILTLGQWTAAAGNQCKWFPHLNQVVRLLFAHPEKQTLPFVNTSSSIPMELAYIYSHPHTSPASCTEVEAESSDKALAVRADPDDHFAAAISKDQMDATIGTEISQYCQPTALNCNLTLNRNSNKQARNEVKMHLLALGWRLSFKPRPGKEKCDLCYVSPSGRAYYSLFQAFVGWKKEQKAHGLVVRNNDVKAEESVNYALRGASVSRSTQKTGLRVRRNMLSSTAESKRLHRICSSSEVVIYDSNNHKTAEDASKINKGPKKSVSRGKRLYHHVKKKTSGTRDMFTVPESIHRTKACDLQSEHFDQPIARSPSTKGARLRKAVQGSLVSSRKKQKLGSEDSLGVKRKRKSTSGFRMQVLLSAPGESKDSSSGGKDKRNASSVLSWMIENHLVAEKQKVHYFNSQKEGWVTYEGILCACCSNVYSLTDFEAHAGSKRHRPSANIILEDGRSLLQCQMQVLDNDNRTNGCRTKGFRAQLRGRKKNHDECMICHVGGHLVLCDHCPNSFHIKCINLESVPKQEKWYCPTCRCAICGSSEFNGNPELFTELTVLFCDQCECQYHVGCLYERGMPKLDSCPEGNWFCSNKCSELRNLVGVVNPMGVGGLSWTLLRSTEGDVKISDQNSDEVMAEYRSKLSVAVSVMHECFAPMIETTTKKDIINELIFNKGCDGNWLNFRGFYTMILQMEDDFVSVATVRIYGQRVAEMPLIGTRIKYRYQGMCRLLVKELEKLLLSLGVERLILPAVPELKQTWLKSFGFQEMTSAERFELLKHNFMNFPDTTVLQKIVARVTLEQEIVTETDACQNGVEPSHPSPGSRLRRVGIEKEIVPATVVFSALNHKSYIDVAETVSPICSLPFDTPVSHCNPEGEGCFDEEMKASLSKRYPHIGSTYALTKNQSESTMEDETIGGTRSTNPLVRKLKWKEQLNNDKEGNGRRKRRTEETTTDNECPPICLTYPGESLEHKNIHFGACETRESDEDISIIWSRTIAIRAESYCLSNSKESSPAFDETTSFEDGSNHVAENREVECSNSHATTSKHHREKQNGYASCLKSFKYCYSRRRKQVCVGNGLSGEIPSVVSFPVKSSVLHSSTVC
ncbi:uncharacterized protein LOC131061996 isoform X3 [Cryptomeria japonica]|uniref:uncharacterized protein LOC131061996 isoform X3 n=1 Tax=Cryptomeria japonica TaxID=3369 RepID=UPI0025AC2619|nr:uncharacterized protein LOC131061996 isoform X3 [Cryptomeria japonica]